LETEISLDSIEWNPYNSRLHYSDSNIKRLNLSLGKHGQLVPVKVRASLKHSGKYELVYGHRRFLAAKNLGWKSIRAEIVQVDESQMILESLIENLEREELSDYEKAITFKKLNKDFHLTYEKIGELLGISKQHVGNYVSMLDLFDANYQAQRPELVDLLHRITEHHARILLRVKDNDLRRDLLERVAKENISTRELTSIVGRLRSWFKVGDNNEIVDDDGHIASSRFFSERSSSSSSSSLNYQKQKEQILSLIVNKMRFIHTGDFQPIEEMKIFDESFSLFSAFPPFEKIEKEYAISKVRNWTYELAPKLTCKVSDFDVEFLHEDVALVTLTLSYSGLFHGRPLKMRAGGTIILLKKNEEWKIRHEHWSRLSGTHTDLLESVETRSSMRSE
jgi:ParB/RepB/Spo0J family partition protein